MHLGGDRELPAEAATVRVVLRLGCAPCRREGNAEGGGRAKKDCSPGHPFTVPIVPRRKKSPATPSQGDARASALEARRLVVRLIVGQPPRAEHQDGFEAHLGRHIDSKQGAKA